VLPLYFKHVPFYYLGILDMIPWYCYGILDMYHGITMVFWTCIMVF